MNFLGVGPQELILIVVILLLVLGPKEMVNTGTKVGGFIRKVVTSDAWKTMKDTTREIRNMPNKLAREAGLEEFKKQIEEQESLGTIGNPLSDIPRIDPTLDAWTTGPKTNTGDEDEDEGEEKPPDQAESTDEETGEA